MVHTALCMTTGRRDTAFAEILLMHFVTTRLAATWYGETVPYMVLQFNRANLEK